MAALTLFGAFMTMRIPGINSDAATILLAVSVGVAAVLAALAGIIRTWQPRWATVVLLLWLAFNFLATLVTAPVSLGMILSAAATAVAARATIGAFKAAQFKRNAPRVPDVPAVFD
jgi:4-amino-4-deoxy-L-arabinose transferase-like glycosyltransferase